MWQSIFTVSIIVNHVKCVYAMQNDTTLFYMSCHRGDHHDQEHQKNLTGATTTKREKEKSCKDNESVHVYIFIINIVPCLCQCVLGSESMYYVYKLFVFSLCHK